MKAERPECREWRLSLGAYALGHLDADEHAAMEAHLDGCPECRAEAESLTSLAHLLPLADPARFDRPAPKPAAELGERIAATIAAEGRTHRRQRQRRRFAFGLAAATAAAAVILAIVLLPGGDESQPAEHIAFSSTPADVHIWATLEPHSYGTEIHMYVKGVRSGTLCQVFLKGPHGERVSAGTFRYRWGDDSDAVLSAALDLSRTRALGVRAGHRTFIAPVDAKGSTALRTREQEEAT
ncbi:MAG: zf-HC2 domain-containing protein [Solirubrobacterales bacterium]